MRHAFGYNQNKNFHGRELMPLQRDIRIFRIGEATIQVEVASNFLQRFLGLMGRKSLPPGHGLLLTDCTGVHMCFMRFPIDVVYTDEDFKIRKTVENLRPWLGVSMCFGARNALELATNEIRRLKTSI